MLVVRLGSTCLSALSVLHSECAFSDLVQLLISQLQGLGGNVLLDVVADRMLVGAGEHNNQCAVCASGLRSNATVATFAEAHCNSLIAQFQPNVIIPFGSEAVALYVGKLDDVFLVVWPHVEGAVTARH